MKKKTKKHKTASGNESTSTSSCESSGTKLLVGWEQRFKELKAFKSKHGHCLVPQSSGGPYKNLGQWVSPQRAAHSKYVKEKEAGKPSSFSSIMEKCIAQLEEIGFVWSLRSPWEQHFEELKTFKNKY